MVKEDGKEWRHPFPVTREHTTPSSLDPISYGDYFSAIRQFLEKDNYDNLVSAVSLASGKNISPEEIEGVSAFLVKHGEYYHPSKIEVLLSKEKQLFVLNVAVTESGIACMEKEYASLMCLNREKPNSYIPDVFIKGSVHKINKTISMVVGEWFENYHEFHLSVARNNEKAIIVWDPVLGNYLLPKNQEKELYRQATKILTFFYNPIRFSKVNSWHHAAGDFVIKRDDNKIDVKLITVRNYASPFTEEDRNTHEGLGEKLDALFVFFINLSIRMRIDRKEGTGEFIWSDDTAVEGMVRGFFEGMEDWGNVGENPFSWTESFIYYLSRNKEEDLRGVAHDIVSSYHPDAPDTPVVKQHVRQHIRVLYKEIKNLTATQDESNTI
jgi:hypothetical protein